MLCEKLPISAAVLRARIALSDSAPYDMAEMLKIELL